VRRAADANARAQDNKDKLFNKLCDLSTSERKAVPVSGLQFERFPVPADAPPRFFVMAVTPSRQYQFIGGPTFEAVFQKQENLNFQEILGAPKTELRFYSKPGGQATACAWLVRPGVFYASMVFGAGDVLSDPTMWFYPVLDAPAPPSGRAPESGPPPISIMLTEFHYLLLYPNRLIAYNRLSEERVLETEFDGAFPGVCLPVPFPSRARAMWH
jgi:hypothetical protein